MSHYLDDESFNVEKQKWLNFIKDKEKEIDSLQLDNENISDSFQLDLEWNRKQENFFRKNIAPKLPDSVNYNAAFSGFSREFPVDGSTKREIEDLRKEDKEEIKRELQHLREDRINHILLGLSMWIFPALGLYLLMVISSKTIRWIIKGFRK